VALPHTILRNQFLGHDHELVIENKGSGMSLIQELKNENIHAIKVDPEGDKVMRA
jgi:phage terminase large subunit-like protein